MWPISQSTWQSFALKSTCVWLCPERTSVGREQQCIQYFNCGLADIQPTTFGSGMTYVCNKSHCFGSEHWARINTRSCSATYGSIASQCCMYATCGLCLRLVWSSECRVRELLLSVHSTLQSVGPTGETVQKMGIRREARLYHWVTLMDVIILDIYWWWVSNASREENP